MVSVIRAPLNRVPKLKPMMVTTGIRALRRACTLTTRPSPTPLARAVRIWSIRMVSIMEARTKRVN